MELINRFFQVPDRSCFIPDALFVDLLEPSVHRSLSARPERLRELIAGSPGGESVVIDEVQRVPELLTVVHAVMEVKNAGKVHSTDLRALRGFRDDYPEAETAVLYRGVEKLRIDGIWCLPVEEFLRRMLPDRGPLAWS